MPPWTGRDLGEQASTLETSCAWLLANDVVPAELVTRNRELATALDARLSGAIAFFYNDAARLHQAVTLRAPQMVVVDTGAVRAEFGDNFEVVYPSISVLAETPVAVIDKVVDRKGVRKQATAYLNFLYSEAGQQIGLREQHIDRDSNAKLVMQLAHTAANGARMNEPFALSEGGEIG